MLKYKCLDCGYQFSSEKLFPICQKCGGWVEVYWTDKELKKVWANKKNFKGNSVWRYHSVLPVKNMKNVVTMNEGNIALIHLDSLGKYIGHPRIFFRDERGGTGSFKDRSASLVISFLKEKGVKEFVVASTGNIATAYTAYAVRANIEIYVCIPWDSAPQKADEASACGARVVRVQGDYAETKDFAVRLAKLNDWVSDVGSRCPIRWEAKKTMAYNDFEVLGDIPDVYLQALSGGSGMFGYIKGVSELQRAKQTERSTRFIGVQAEGCAPMAAAFKQGEYKKYNKVKHPKTSVPTLATGDPQAYPRLAPIVALSGGEIMSVPEESIPAAAVILGRLEGLLVDSATAVAIAGLIIAIQTGKISPKETVVVSGGASILKDIDFLSKLKEHIHIAKTPEEVSFGKDNYERAISYFGIKNKI
jgi:threonine synthase